MSSRLLGMIVVLCLAGSTVSGCGSSSSGTPNGSAHLAKTKFLLHAGFAFGAFHRFIYQPLKAGFLRHPFRHKVFLIRSGLAALFIRRELRLAAADARASPALRRLIGPMTAVGSTIASLSHGLPSGHVSARIITRAESQLNAIGSVASRNGQSIKDILPDVLQLSG